MVLSVAGIDEDVGARGVRRPSLEISAFRPCRSPGPVVATRTNGCSLVGAAIAGLRRHHVDFRPFLPC